MSRRLAESSQKQREHERRLIAERRARLSVEFHAALMRMDIPDRHAKRETFESGIWLQNLDWLKERCGKGLMAAILGDRGKGKTQMAVEVLKHNARRKLLDLAPTDDSLLDREAFEKVVSGVVNCGLFIEMTDLLADIKQAFGDKSSQTDSQRAKKFKRPQLLVVDEVQEGLRSDWERMTFVKIINRRYNGGLDTLFIGNTSRDRLGDCIGHNVYDRIMECGGVLECSWPSFRTGE